MNRVAGILQPGYLPWLGYFEQVARVDIFVHYDDVQFEKGSWRNRNRIRTKNGPLILTVPVITKGEAFPLICDVKINNRENWRKKHVASISQNYRNAPYFYELAPNLFSILGKGHKFLLDLNLELLAWLLGALDIDTSTVLSSELGVGGKGGERLIGIVRHLGCGSLYEGAAGRNYIDETLFESAGIGLEYQDYNHPEYGQLYPGFISHLSIIDLLFNHGPESGNIVIRNKVTNRYTS